MQHDDGWVSLGTGSTRVGSEERGQSSVWPHEIADQSRRLFRNVGKLDQRPG
jgi:hypothetical protein